MILVHDKGLNYLQFPMLSRLPGFFHGIFMRRTSDGQGTFGDFNLAMGCGTPEDQVLLNRQKMLDAFGNGYHGVYARQVHGTKVIAWRPHSGPPATTRLEGDALATDSVGHGLVIQTADCQPVIVMDPVRHVVANIHSGWRGSVGNILGQTIKAMEAEFKCQPRDLVCGIGPSLGPCCAEFINFAKEIPQSLWGYRSTGNYFNFWQISVDQLAAAGVEKHNIEIAGICTKCNQHLFFSYRGDAQTGRFATIAGLQSEDEGRI